MLLKIFTVFDCKAEAYLQPFFMKSKGEAIRAFSDTSNDQNHNFGKHPEDFTLFELGTYDESNASIEMLSTPQSLGKAIEFVKN
jgi:hypothetical protein